MTWITFAVIRELGPTLPPGRVRTRKPDFSITDPVAPASGVWRGQVIRILSFAHINLELI
ncbi:hypothetical protein [Paenibacillus pabuli]|uniref:hypothetical protein n=1 Tax=Paenibacillus pabuli TaxID=1472 RepID=UPI001C3F3312|nr:hypothetical protein [Paenibacillus pabuli]